MNPEALSQLPIPAVRQRLPSLSVPPMPWFGLDIGGTLTKLVYFEPTDYDEFKDDDDQIQRMKTIRHYLVNNKAYGETGIRDDHLELKNVSINSRRGTLHFIRFPTERMAQFIQLVKSKGFALMSSTVCATGGGAIKYAVQAELVSFEYMNHSNMSVLGAPNAAS